MHQGGRLPGIPGLLTLLSQHWEAIEADLQRYYAVDLSDLWRGTLTLRRIAVLLRGMPPGSALARHLGGDQAWSDDVAAILMGLWRVECQILAAAGVKQSAWPKQPKPPEPGWIDKAQAKAEREKTKAERWLARHPELNVTV